MVNKKFGKESFSNGRWQEMWSGPFSKISIQKFFYQIIQTKVKVV